MVQFTFEAANLREWGYKRKTALQLSKTVYSTLVD